ncbi:MAG: hypothetical protein GX986_03945, partial [Firmicutes bacterium]|nr:hypothetical protein [Bacillota bacterium]
EYNNLALLGMLPGIEAMGDAPSQSGTENEAPASACGAVPTVTDIVGYIGPVMAPLLHTLYSSLAAIYGLYDGWEFSLKPKKCNSPVV